ncbi:MAG: MarR family transcriptional regulator [Lachnospiraceae bacterium]|nr:MarR family transcriptional regulator [Lachnospiraceae bacterium]
MLESEKKFQHLIDEIYEAARIDTYNNISPKNYGTGDLLYSNEVHTLKLIAENEGLNQNELAEKTYRRKGTVSVTVDKLESKGLIEKRVDLEDRRRSCLFVTEKGRLVHEKHADYDNEIYKKMRAGIKVTDEQLDNAIYVLGECLKYFRSNIYHAKNCAVTDSK